MSNIKINNYKKSQTEFIYFVLACGVAALANFSSRIVFGFLVFYEFSIILAYIVGIITAYLLCRKYVFRSKKNRPQQEVTYFILVNVFAIIQTLVVSVLCCDYLFINFISNLSYRESLSHFLGVCFPVFSSYFGHKYFSFK
jgi:putative flippase GtrA